MVEGTGGGEGEAEKTRKLCSGWKMGSVSAQARAAEHCSVRATPSASLPPTRDGLDFGPPRCSPLQCSRAARGRRLGVAGGGSQKPD